MNASFLQQNILTLMSQRKNLMSLTGFLCCSNVILASALFFKSERIILVPPEIHKTLWVKGGEVSTEYLEEMGLYMAKLLRETSPSSSFYNRETLLKYAAHCAYGALKKQLIKEEEEHAKLQLSTSFRPLEIIADPKALTVQVKGQLVSYVANKHIRDEQETLKLTFSLRGAGLLLESVTQLSQKGDQNAI